MMRQFMHQDMRDQIAKSDVAAIRPFIVMGRQYGSEIAIQPQSSTSLVVAVGPQGFAELLAGMHAMDEHFRTAPLARARSARLKFAFASCQHWEQGFFNAEGLTVEFTQDNPKGVDGRVQDFSQRWKESQLSQGALEVYPVCEWGAIERVQQLGGGKIIGLDTTARTGAIMVRKDSAVQTLADLRGQPAVPLRAEHGFAARPVREQIERDARGANRDLGARRGGGGQRWHCCGVRRS